MSRDFGLKRARTSVVTNPVATATTKMTTEITKPPNGEVEGPPRSAQQAPRAHTVVPRSRRGDTGRSRSPPTIVRSHQDTEMTREEITSHESPLFFARYSTRAEQSG